MLFLLAPKIAEDLAEPEDDIGDYEFTTGAGGESGKDCELCGRGRYVDASSLVFSEFDAGTSQCNNCGYVPGH